MMLFDDEKDLRKWLRAELPENQIKWIEPARGSSIGFPDVVISKGTMSWPVELKHWKFSTKGLMCKMRPAQIRYHIMAHRNGQRTAILFACCSGLFMIPGGRCPRSMYELRLDGSIADVRNKFDIYHHLQDEKFWEIT